MSAVTLSCRELFHDWANEDVLDLEIIRQGCEQQPRPPLDAAAAVALMDKVGQLTKNQVHFWNAFYTLTLETYGKVPGMSSIGDPDRQFMPINDMNPPNALGIATGGGPEHQRVFRWCIPVAVRMKHWLLGMRTARIAEFYGLSPVQPVG